MVCGLFVACKAPDYKRLWREFPFVSLRRVLLSYLNDNKIMISLGIERTAQVRGYLGGESKEMGPN